MKKVYVSFIVVILLILVSCSTMNNGPGGKPSTGKAGYVRGIWHKVEEGQTLWRIAKTYSIPLDEVKRTNDIEDVLHISPGTWIFIPGAKKHLYVQGSITSGTTSLGNFSLQLPVKGKIIGKFGKRKYDFNYGIDIKVLGSKYIITPQNGIVIYSGFIRGYGPVIIIDHGNNFYSLYTKDIDPIVKEGQKIEAKTIIAKTIKKRGSDFPVIHFELYYKGKPVNPLYYIR